MYLGLFRKSTNRGVQAWGANDLLTHGVDRPWMLTYPECWPTLNAFFWALHYNQNCLPPSIHLSDSDKHPPDMNTTWLTSRARVSIKMARPPVKVDKSVVCCCLCKGCHGNRWCKQTCVTDHGTKPLGFYNHISFFFGNEGASKYIKCLVRCSIRCSINTYWHTNQKY